MYIDKSIGRYLADLAAKMPAPGGGSASALAGAVGASLASMVANYTLGKEKYRHLGGAVREILQESEEIRSKMEHLVDEDVIAYKRLSDTFRLKRGADIDDALKEATSIPMETAKLSLKGAKLCSRFVDKCNKNLISDIGVAMEMLEASYSSAKFNIEINLSTMKDEKFILDVRKALKMHDDEITEIKNVVLEKVRSIMRS